MNDYLVFNTQSAADTALETIYSNMVKAVDSPDLLDVQTQDVVVKAALSPSEIVETNSADRRFPVFGVNAATGITNVETGHTTAWAVAQVRVDGKWQFPKPDASLMIGVSNFVVEPYDPATVPQPAL